MHVEPGMPRQPFVDLRVFMGGVIVGDDVDVEFGGALLIDQFEKGEPFLMTVARRQAGNQLAFEIIERREQGQSAVPHVIMGLGANVPDPQGQTGLRAFERLALRFLVAAHHQRLVRRVEIKPDDIPELLFKPLVI